MALTVETHPQRTHIINSLLGGVSTRKIAATLNPPLHYTSLNRYKKQIVRPALSRAAATAKVLGESISMEPSKILDVAVETAAVALRDAPVTDIYTSRVRKHQATLDKAIENAMEEKDGRSVAALVATDYKGVELDARLNHALDAPMATPNVNLAIMVQIPRSTAPAEVRQVESTDVEFREIPEGE